MGFTKVDREYESGFTATNADGTYKVDIDYLDFMDNSLEVTLTKL